MTLASTRGSYNVTTITSQHYWLPNPGTKDTVEWCRQQSTAVWHELTVNLSEQTWNQVFPIHGPNDNFYVLIALPVGKKEIYIFIDSFFRARFTCALEAYHHTFPFFKGLFCQSHCCRYLGRHAHVSKKALAPPVSQCHYTEVIRH